jgi:LuxR family maltose regulon positive regulatory protein
MPDILLATKLTIPPIRRELVARPRLLEQLNAGLERKLTLLSAPAGFGKTTLLGTWAAHCGHPVAWLTIDEDDNDPARFQRYLSAAVGRIGIQHGPADTAEALPVRPGLDEWLTDFINQAASFQRDFLLVLDDVHLLTSQPIHSILGYLLEHLPENLHLVLASRADPSLPLARLRARGELTEVRLADLRFTAEEALAFLNQVMHLGLTGENSTALVVRTEGWIAGLQMAALALQGHISLQNRPDISAFIQAFTGSNRHILDYLMEEVLQRQPPEINTFLLKTSILEQMCGPLCEALLPGLNGGNGQAMLERLERANLFVLPLDDRRNWYRYHRLFADLLQRQLEQSYPVEIPDLHRRASLWFEAQVLPEEAIEHALLAGDFERAAGVIESAAEEMLMASQTTTLQRWVASLPGNVVSARPHLHVYAACTRLLEGQSLGEAERQLQDIFASGSLHPAHLAPLQAFLAIYQGRLPHAVRLAQQALDELPETDRFLRSVAEWIVNIASIYSVDRTAALPVIEQVIQLSQRAGNLMLAVMSVANLGDTYLSKGDIALAEQFYRRALEMAVDLQGRPLPVSGLPLVRLGEILRERNHLQDAEDMLKEGIQRLRSWHSVGAIFGLLSLAMLQQARGNAATANATAQKARQSAANTDSTQVDDLLSEIIQVRLWLIQGELERVRDWLAQPKPDAALGELEPQLRLHIHFLRTRALIALGRAAESLPMLDALLPELEKAGRKRRVMEMLNLTALAYETLGKHEQALATLERALTIAEAGGFVRTVLDEGPVMRRLLDTLGRRGHAYAAFLAAGGQLPEAAPSERVPMAGKNGLAPGVEPLSQRELEVLNLLVEGLSNPEIAERLFVTVRTVKFHTSNILAKLGVSNRTQAVVRARALGLF